MNWDAIGAIGEVLGSIGVVATLLYLASEFRNNVKKSQMDGLAKAIESQARQFAHLTNEEEKAELVRRALIGFDDLTQGEKGLIHSIFFDINKKPLLVLAFHCDCIEPGMSHSWELVF